MARGSVYQRPDGKWGYRLDLPSSGKRKQESRSGFRLRADAQSALSKRVVEVEQGIGVNPSLVTVTQYMAFWLAGKDNIGDATWRSYASTIRNCIDPQLGSIRLGRLSVDDVENCFRSVAETHPASVACTRTVLGMALDLAVRQGVVSRNVVRLARSPSRSSRSSPVWSASEVQGFLQATASTVHAAYFRLLLSSGMRRGEAEALRWSDLDGSWLTISRTVTSTRNGQRVIGTTTKTTRSQRRIQLDAGTLSILKEHRVRQSAARLAAPIWRDQGLIFPGRHGGIASLRMHDDALRRYSSVAGVPPLTVHGLRHTYITHALINGEQPHVIAQRVGHSVAMLFSRYAHVIESQQEQAAERAGRWLDQVG